MKCSTARCTLALLAATIAGVADAAAGHKTAVGTPVERVVTLLKDLRNKLEMDEKVEQQIYDKYACWCQKTTDRKSQAISRAQQDLRALGQTILSTKGRIATLTSEIEEKVAAAQANAAAQTAATSIRQKENAEFMASTAEAKQAIAALQQAITVLIEGSMGGEASLLQESERMGAALKSVIGSLPNSGALKPEQVEQLTEFMQQANDNARYMPQSFTVQGILTDMYATFAADVESATREEARANRVFEEYIALKAEQAKQLKKQIAVREEEKAEQDEKLADTQEIYDDTMAQKAADIAFFDETKQACVAKHEAWTTRSSLRAEELAGVTQAMQILSQDDVRELFASTIKEGKETMADDQYETGRDISMNFLQVQRGSDAESAMLARAYSLLKKQASKVHSLRLAALAVRVHETKVGHFDKVIESIDSMVTELREEGEADIKKRDQCKDQYFKIESKVKEYTWLIKRNNAQIAKLEATIATRTEERTQTQEEISRTVTMMSDLTAERRAENHAFIDAKSDDQLAIDELMAARGVLLSYYRNHSIELGPIQGAVKGLALNQQHQPEFEVSADQAPEAIFSGKGKRKYESKDIVSILTMIIEDLDDEIKNSMKAEEGAQLEYEGLMDAGRKLEKDLRAKKVSLTEAIAKREGEKTDEEGILGENVETVTEEKEYKAKITDDCDFVIRAFETRAADRTAEMNGLVGAKEYLAKYVKGPQEASFLERKVRATFHDEALSKVNFLGIGR